MYKPILPETIFNLGRTEINSIDWDFSVNPKFSSTFGMILRKRIYKFIYGQTGIAYVSRKYNYELTFKDSLLLTQSFSIIGYEIPLEMLIYVPFSEKWISNSSIGISSDFLSTGLSFGNTNLTTLVTRNNWICFAFTANSGMELKTKKAGSLYLGFSLHQPFKDLIATSTVLNKGGNQSSQWKHGISGAYFTLDFKYYLQSKRKNDSDK